MKNITFVNEKKRSTAVFYLTATCNLKCRYCYIDKSEILVKIDKLLEDSFKGDYYFNFLKQLFPDPNQLENIEFWGGEPSYGLPRAKNLIENAIQYYPNLKTFMMSTNLTTDKGLSDFLNFITIFRNFPERKFEWSLQLSLDGPVWINDVNRGQNTTQLFIQHFSQLIFQLNQILPTVPNLFISAFFKPTLDSSSIAQLQTKEKVLEYYQFFEKFKQISDKYITCHDQFSFSLGQPNTATPSPHTIKDGQNFANFCKICYEINFIDNDKDLKYPRIIIPFTNFKKSACQNKTLYGGCGTCGSGSFVVGLLPNNLISSCHSGFVDLLEDYKKKCEEQKEFVDRTILSDLFLNGGATNNAIYTLEEYAKYEKEMNCFNPKARFQIAEMASLIQFYAFGNQIDKKYINNTEAILAAHFIQDHTASCVRDNLGTTGSKYLFQIGYIKLFLNGAKEIIEDAERNIVSKRIG